MILQPLGEGGWRIFRQTDHALLSGAFARAWRLTEIPCRDRTLIAAARHDDGWADWEAMPRLRSDGRPMDFMKMPAEVHVDIFKRSADLVEAEDPWAGCVASMHCERLYSRPFVPGMRPRLETLETADLVVARRYVEGERHRQARLAASQEAPPDDLEECWRLMQVWDRLSLFVCMNQLGSGATTRLPAVRGGIELSVATPEPGVVAIDPFPFDDQPAPFEIQLRDLAGGFADESAYREAWRAAPFFTLELSCRPS